MSKTNKINTLTIITLKICLFVFMIAITLLCFPVVFVCFFIYPINKKICLQIITFAGTLHWQIESIFFNLTADVSFKGLEKIKSDRNYIICSNHLGTMDYFLIHELARKKGNLNFLKYLLKDSLFWIPILGQGMYIGGFCFLSRNFIKDKIKIKNWVNLFKKSSLPIWPIIYPEGTRITPQKKALADEFCRKNNYPIMEYTLFPRKKGFDIIKKEFRGYADEVLSLTLFFNGKKVPTLFDIFLGNQCLGEFKVIVDVYKNDENCDVVEIFKNINKNLSEIKKNK